MRENDFVSVGVVVRLANRDHINARELSRVCGDLHYSHEPFPKLSAPAFSNITKEYETGPTKGVAAHNMKGTADAVPEGAEPIVVAEALVELAAMPRGKKVYRMTADPSDVGNELGAGIVDRLGDDFYRRLGLGSLLKVTI